jgi:hypothetical protein
VFTKNVQELERDLADLRAIAKESDASVSAKLKNWKGFTIVFLFFVILDFPHCFYLLPIFFLIKKKIS